MTLAEQQRELDQIITEALYGRTVNYRQGAAKDLRAAVSAAGFSIVRPEVTMEMRKAIKVWWDPTEIFQKMLAAGDLARKIE